MMSRLARRYGPEMLGGGGIEWAGEMPKMFRRLPPPLVATLCLIALTLSGLFIGYEPVGADPDNMYRPIKSELVRALRQGHLPLWSDLFGIGIPLAAESHVAAFYPPNWILYGSLGTAVAYRLSIFLHYIALAASTYAYARALGLASQGAALAALSFTLSGFQTSHLCHEPFYSLLPYLPLSLCFAERYLAEGRIGWLAGIALAVGIQITLGHFQIQFWTAGLVVLTGFWRAARKEASWRRAGHLVGAVLWAVAIAAVQLGLTMELRRVGGFNRPEDTLVWYAYPPSHWAQLAYPQLFMGLREEPGRVYWRQFGSLADEATLYVGTVTLIFAFAGYFAKSDRKLALWRWLIPLGFILATMPQWWLDGYFLILKIPGLGLFRAPGRYTLLTTLGLCLLAGRGCERSLPDRRFRIGFRLSAAFAAAAFAWSFAWSMRADFLDAIGKSARMGCLVAATLTWVAALASVAAWRSRRIAFAIPFLIVACELAYLFHHGPTEFGWAHRFPEDSPALRQLTREKNVGLVAGWLCNIPIRMGYRSADPYVGITAPPPNYLLAAASHPELVDYDYRSWMRRFGVTHGVIESTTTFLPSEVLWEGEDPVLNAILPRATTTPVTRVFRVERYGDAFPEAHVATKVGVAKNWFEIFPKLCEPVSLDQVWFLEEDLPLNPPGHRANTAKLLRWDGRSGEVEHDGTCDLVLRRAYYPGWTARINGGDPFPVSRADGGLQAVRLPGSGISKVQVTYRPTGLYRYGAVSVLAVLAATITLILQAVPYFRSRLRLVSSR